MRRLLTPSILAAMACGGGTSDAPAPPAADAATGIQVQEVTYQQGATQLRGYVAWDASKAGPRPGVLVVHEWWGHNDYVRGVARRLAEAGYVGFAVDMYGEGKSTTHPDTANTFMRAALADQAAMQARFAAALAQLKANPLVDSTRIGAIGYCFGGMVVLAQARAGSPDLDVVASFHGAIPPPAPIDSGSVKARVLIMNGGNDPMVPDSVVRVFANAYSKAGGSVMVVSYPGAQHSFSNPFADSVAMNGVGYNADVARQSWDAMIQVLAQTWPKA